MYKLLAYAIFEINTWDYGWNYVTTQIPYYFFEYIILSDKLLETGQ